jgi:hypothetical protein
MLDICINSLELKLITSSADIYLCHSHLSYLTEQNFMNMGNDRPISSNPVGTSNSDLDFFTLATAVDGK